MHYSFLGWGTTTTPPDTQSAGLGNAVVVRPATS